MEYNKVLNKIKQDNIDDMDIQFYLALDSFNEIFNKLSQKKKTNSYKRMYKITNKDIEEKRKTFMKNKY